MLYTTAEENYPVGIGKHIVFIDAAAHGTALQTACRGNPEPPYYFSNPTVAESEVNKTKNKTKMVAMRFSESDHRAIKRKAEQANMNFTEFITASALNKRITVIEGLDGVLKEQKAIGRNLNQLTTLCNIR